MARRSDAEWQQLLSEYEQSGLSQKAFCQQKQICPKGLGRYKRKVSGDLQAKRAFVEVKRPMLTLHHSVKVELGAMTIYLPLEPCLPTAQLIKALQ